MSAPAWFKSLNDVPGITFKYPVDVDPRGLPGFGFEPDDLSTGSLGAFERDLDVEPPDDDDDPGSDRFWWPVPGEPGTTSGTSPATSYLHVLDNRRNLTANDVLEALSGALQLPGTLHDYFWVLESCANRLLGMSADAEALDIGEQLTFMVVDVAVAFPKKVLGPYRADKDNLLWISAVNGLGDLYAREGHFAELRKLDEKLSPLADQLRRGRPHAERIEELREQHLGS